MLVTRSLLHQHQMTFAQRWSGAMCRIGSLLKLSRPRRRFHKLSFQGVSHRTVSSDIAFVQVEAEIGTAGGDGGAAVGAAGGDGGVGNSSLLCVTGCTHGTVGPVIRGSFQHCGENHGKPTYRKDAQVYGLEVMIYYWDKRDGPSYCGWWFGPKVGGDQVWAHQPASSMTPPTGGWKVPYDGPPDTSIALAPRIS